MQQPGEVFFSTWWYNLYSNKQYSCSEKGMLLSDISDFYFVNDVIDVRKDNAWEGRKICILSMIQQLNKLLFSVGNAVTWQHTLKKTVNTWPTGAGIGDESEAVHVDQNLVTVNTCFRVSIPFWLW